MNTDGHRFSSWGRECFGRRSGTGVPPVRFKNKPRPPKPATHGRDARATTLVAASPRCVHLRPAVVSLPATHAFSLIEMIGVLAVIAILAAALVPNVIRRMDIAARQRETSDLKVM